MQKSSTGIWDWLLKSRSSGSSISIIVIPLAFVRYRGHTNMPLLTHYTNTHNVRGAKKSGPTKNTCSVVRKCFIDEDHLPVCLFVFGDTATSGPGPPHLRSF